MEAMWIGFDQFHLCVKIGIEALGTGYDGFNVQYPIYIPYISWIWETTEISAMGK